MTDESGELTLEKIAQEQDIVLLDTNVLSHPMNIREDEGFEYYFDSRKPERLDRILNQFSDVYDILKANQNICISQKVSEEFRKLKKQARSAARNQRKVIKKFETFSRAGKFSRDGAEGMSQNAILVLRLDEKLGYILGRISDRCLMPDERIYQPMKDIIINISKEIDKFPEGQHRSLKFENQKNTNDECIVAHAFALALGKKKNVALLSGDRRVPVLIGAAYNALYSEDLSPDNMNIIDALMDNPVSMYFMNDKSKRFVKNPIEITDFCASQLSHYNAIKLLARTIDGNVAERCSTAS